MLSLLLNQLGTNFCFPSVLYTSTALIIAAGYPWYLQQTSTLPDSSTLDGGSTFVGLCVFILNSWCMHIR